MEAGQPRKAVEGEETEQHLLELMSYRACYDILKLVYSAAANANHNKGLNETSLIISKAEVNEGTTVKKLKPRARGRGYPIRRSTCHITIVLKDISVDEQLERDKRKKQLRNI